MRAISCIATAIVLCVACSSAGSALSEPAEPPLVKKAANYPGEMQDTFQASTVKAELKNG
jgi:hypothetical protein